MANVTAPIDQRFSLYWGAKCTPVEVPELKLAENLTYDECMRVMASDRALRFPTLGFYVRSWCDAFGITNLDYGSWSDFYFIVPEGLTAEMAI